jgi:hypothetical protein
LKIITLGERSSPDAMFRGCLSAKELDLILNPVELLDLLLDRFLCAVSGVGSNVTTDIIVLVIVAPQALADTPVPSSVIVALGVEADTSEVKLDGGGGGHGCCSLDSDSCLSATIRR